MDVAIDKRKNQLVLLTEPSALLRFDAEGNFISSRKLPGYYHSIALDGDFIYLENETYANGRLSENSITAIHGVVGTIDRNCPILFYSRASVECFIACAVYPEI